MKIDFESARKLLKNFDFKTLFREQLGWDNFSVTLPVEVNGIEYRLSGVAHKRGFAAYLCESMPDSATRLKIYRQAAKATHEQMIVYADRAVGEHVWQWGRREGSTIANREQRYDASKSGTPLLQKLEALAVSFDEEELVTLPDVSAKARAAFDKDRVTKRFYDTFKTEHKAFMGFIRGIKAAGDLEWYTSLMMNRMMFIYFIQKKGFLDGDVEYLRHRLRLVQERRGRDKFQTFYRYFLLRLFHEGLGSTERNPELDALLGKVPYLNGGFFEVHELERKYEIDIPDDAFEKLFQFFDAWEWTLDDRPLRKDNEINPDVVGYIFEKYINQKQMGAYYTKEDITEYISKNTVLPHLFDAAKKECAIAFRPDGLLWRMLQANPDRYIYEPVRRGVIDDKGQVIPLPPEIEAGINDVSKRGEWNRPAVAHFALPTETWREHVARRKQCLEIRAKLAAGEVHEINDLITLNLDIWQFARDAIANAEGPELLRAFWHQLHPPPWKQGLAVLDPACGSGAFLFAALRILETLYSACIQRMRQFLDDLERSGEKHRPEKFKDFRQVLAEIDRHPNESYYVLKSIIVGNLFGVDIMEEAVEICKLRLFLKLAAQVQTPDHMEPLPDIDFNIRAGNSLVGFTSLDAVREAMAVEGAQGRLLSLTDSAKKTLLRIEEEADRADRQFKEFRRQQTEYLTPAADFARSKADLRKRLVSLRSELDRYLAHEYGVDPDKSVSFEKWRASHQPFHWFVEFYGVLHTGGFDAIIGNPPYVECTKVRSQYEVQGFKTRASGNTYALFIERSLPLQADNGSVGLIVPISLMCTDRAGPVRELLLTEQVWVAGFDMRPSSLFEGVAQRLCIFTARRAPSPTSVWAGGFRRWSSDERTHLIQLTQFTHASAPKPSDPLAKISTGAETSILTKIKGTALSEMTDPGGRPLYVHRICRYFIKALDFVPLFIGADGKRGRSEDYKVFRFSDEYSPVALCLINSTLFYWFWRTHGDGFHCGYGDVYLMTLPIPLEEEHQAALARLEKELMVSLKSSSSKKKIETKRGTIEYQEFYPSPSKPVFNKIDATFAKHCALSEEEVDFIINYDIKYRMGQDEAEGAE